MPTGAGSVNVARDGATADRLRRGSRRAAVAAAVAVAAALAGCASTQSPPQWEGLEGRPSRAFDQVYVLPGAEFSQFKRVRLDPAEVAFARSWDPNAGTRDLSRRVTPQDLQEIKDGLAQMLQRTFAEELARGGYEVTTDLAPDVLRVTPQIVDLQVNAPDTMAAGRSRTYVMDAGRMTLVAEARDSVTGQLLARVVDRKQGTDFGTLQWANSVTNSAEAQRAISQWARALRAGLDAVAGRTP
jgi:hypothetical protein